MKVSLKIDDPEGGSFHPRDLVRGSLEIRGATPEKPPRITAILRGQVTLSLSAEPCGPNHGKTTHTFLKQTQEISFSGLTSRKDEDGQITHLGRIELKIPPKADDCSCRKTCQLPSSMLASKPGLSIKTDYSVAIKIDRNVLGLVPKSNLVRKEIHFVSNASAVPCDTVPPTLGFRLDGPSKTAKTIHFKGGKSYAPPYSELAPSLPFMQLQIVMPESSVFMRKHSTPIGLVIRTPPDILETSDIYLRSMSMNFNQSAVARFGTLSRQVVQTLHGCTMDGAVKIEEETFELDSGVWGNFRVLNGQPSCNSCLLRVSHSVDITVGVSRGLGNDIHYIKASLDANVVEPPPAYVA